MLKIGITGGIGSGKTLICRVFSVLGVPVYNADLHARDIMDSDQNVKIKLRQAFGNKVFKGDLPDRKLLAEIVFNDSGALNVINSIVHPAVQDDFESWAQKHSGELYVLHESAILFESGVAGALDKVILVVAPEQERIKRVVTRDGINEELVKSRMKNQWDDASKLKLADFVLHNNGTNPLLKNIVELHKCIVSGHSDRN